MPLAVHALVSVLVVLPQSAPGKDPDEAGFKAGFAQVRGLRDKGDWRAARKLLDQLLAAHSGAGYVRVRRGEIEDVVRGLAFQQQVGTPDVRRLIQGEIASHDPGSGQIRLRYVPGRLDDFVQPQGGRAEDQPEFRHPITFKGVHSIEVKGDSHPGVPYGESYYQPYLFVCARDAGSYALLIELPAERGGSAKDFLLMKLVFTGPSGRETVAEATFRDVRYGQRYAWKLTATASEIRATLNGKLVVRAARKDKGFGSVGFSFPKGWSEVLIEGLSEPSWLQGRIDADLHKAREGFDQRFDPRKVLPEWLYEPVADAGSAAAAGRKDDTETVPGGPDGLDHGSARAVAEVYALLDADQADAAVAALDKAKTLPPATAAWVRAHVEHHRGRTKEALASAREVVAKAPDFLRGHLLVASILFELRLRDEAPKAYDAILARWPESALAHGEAAMAMFHLGMAAKAEAIVAAARAAGLGSQLLDQAAEALRKAVQGPRWARFFTEKSPSYQVISDIDQQTCVDAGRELENALRLYSFDLERLPPNSERFRVYLFSGEQGYKAYLDGVIGKVPIHTAGLYSPALKQLLIWNLPRREDMLRTVRHEGFHQYLDRLMADAPRWFNEGMAEYYENGRMVGGTWRFDGPNPNHQRVLAMDPDFDLAKLVFEDDWAFLRHAQFRYPQSWAFVHYLRLGPPAKEKVFERLWKELRANPIAEDALRKVFPPEVLARLQKDFPRYVRELIDKR
ncbi:MAG: DUF1570 domain-containing protein [Planctomycetes bacterium]|nr:DUF1570 domain-containing protein [Planctomycetota bacterium]